MPVQREGEEQVARLVELRLRARDPKLEIQCKREPCVDAVSKQSPNICKTTRRKASRSRSVYDESWTSLQTDKVTAEVGREQSAARLKWWTDVNNELENPEFHCPERRHKVKMRKRGESLEAQLGHLRDAHVTQAPRVRESRWSCHRRCTG